MKKYPLIKIFIVFSTVAFLLTGIVLSFFISNHIKEDKLANLEEITQYAVKTMTRDILQQSDLNDSLSEEMKIKIGSEMIDLMEPYEIDNVTIFNKQKLIIMSDNLVYWQEQVKNDIQLNQVLQAKAPYFIIETRNNGIKKGHENEQVYNAYEPIIYNDHVEGVVVLQVCAPMINEHTTEVVMQIAVVLFGGLLILFLLLFSVLFKTSRTLFNQNEELSKQKEMLEMSYQKLQASYKSTIIALSNAVDARDTYTAGHSERVTRISLLMGKALNLSADELHVLEYAALLHDIGKVGIPDLILNKKDKLTEDEYAVIKRHPDIGIGILGNIHFLEKAIPIIRHHHEKVDGNGYPTRIKGNEIPLGARIIAIADAYDAMTSDRPYRKSLAHDTAVQEILRCKGAQFDDDLVDVFMKLEKNIKALK